MFSVNSFKSLFDGFVLAAAFFSIFHFRGLTRASYVEAFERTPKLDSACWPSMDSLLFFLLILRITRSLICKKSARNAFVVERGKVVELYHSPQTRQSQFTPFLTFCECRGWNLMNCLHCEQS